MLNKRLIVRRVLRAALFEAPPVMVEGITKRVMHQIAVKALKMMENSVKLPVGEYESLEKAITFLDRWKRFLSEEFEAIYNHSKREIVKRISLPKQETMVVRIFRDRTDQIFISSSKTKFENSIQMQVSSSLDLESFLDARGEPLIRLFQKYKSLRQSLKYQWQSDVVEHGILVRFFKDLASSNRFSGDPSRVPFNLSRWRYKDKADPNLGLPIALQVGLKSSMVKGMWVKSDRSDLLGWLTINFEAADFNTLYELKIQLENIRSAIEHESMHMGQHILDISVNEDKFWFGPEKQFGLPSDRTEKLTFWQRLQKAYKEPWAMFDGYILADNEYHPWILTCARSLETAFKRTPRKSWRMIFQYFVGEIDRKAFQNIVEKELFHRDKVRLEELRANIQKLKEDSEDRDPFQRQSLDRELVSQEKEYSRQLEVEVDAVLGGPKFLDWGENVGIDRSAFVSQLRDLNPDRWKKMVKEIYKELDKRGYAPVSM